MCCSEDKRFSRNELLFGKENCLQLFRSCVCVIGLGGVGSACAEALARSGVGKLILLDFDVVDVSNINRQLLATESTVGVLKVDAQKQRLELINSDIQIDCIIEKLKAEKLCDYVSLFSNCDMVVDAQDTLSVKLELARLSQDESFKLITCAGTANNVYPEYYRFADLFDTHDCRLCRLLRKEGRKRGIKKLKVLYSPEGGFVSGDGIERPVLPSASFVPPAAGFMLAGYVVRSILNISSKSRN